MLLSFCARSWLFTDELFFSHIYYVFCVFWGEGRNSHGKSVGSFDESVPFCYRVDSADQPKVTRLGGRCWPNFSVLGFEAIIYLYSHLQSTVWTLLAHWFPCQWTAAVCCSSVCVSTLSEDCAVSSSQDIRGGKYWTKDSELFTGLCKHHQWLILYWSRANPKGKQSWFCRPWCQPRAWVLLRVCDLMNRSPLWSGHELRELVLALDFLFGASLYLCIVSKKRKLTSVWDRCILFLFTLLPRALLYLQSPL